MIVGIWTIGILGELGLGDWDRKFFVERSVSVTSFMPSQFEGLTNVLIHFDSGPLHCLIQQYLALPADLRRPSHLLKLTRISAHIYTISKCTKFLSLKYLS